MRCCVALHMADTAGTDAALLAAEQYRDVFAARDIVLFSPEGHPLLGKVAERLRPDAVMRQPVAACRHLIQRDAFMQSPDYYDRFSGYDYVMVGGWDTWPLYDALDYWAGRGCDYVAAPWFDPADAHGFAGSASPPRGGCGTASLRSVPACREFMRALGAAPGYDSAKSPMWEDVLLSGGGLPQSVRRRLPELRYVPFAEQARFAWCRPALRGEPAAGGTCTDALYMLTRAALPMLMHAPSTGAAARLCIRDRHPETVFLVSSAAGAGDYAAAMGSAGANDRLVVLFNTCPALDNPSLSAFIAGQPRVLTFHNSTAGFPYGFSGLGAAPGRLARAGFRGRHDLRALRWRPASSAEMPAVTHDGEIPDADMTAALRTVTSDVPMKYAPTAGYMAYRIIRALHPAARIRLVNFFGRDGAGHVVNWRHDPGSECAVYRADPLVDFVTVA